jgi:hypothetical protein
MSAVVASKHRIVTPSISPAVQASGNLHIETWKNAQATARSFISNNIWRAPIAACALGGLMVVLFNLLSCIVLIRQARRRATVAGSAVCVQPRSAVLMWTPRARVAMACSMLTAALHAFEAS